MHTNTASAGYAETVNRFADKALFYALFIVFAVALILAVTNGWNRGITLAYSVAWAAFGVAIVCTEFSTVKKAAAEWKAKNRPMAVLSGTAGVFAFILSSFASFNSAAVNVDETAKVQLSQTNAYEDARRGVNEAGAKVLDERKNLAALRASLATAMPQVGGRDVTTVEAAQSLITAAKADRFWKRTDGCKETLGKDTSKFCKEFREAEAALPALTKRAGMEDQVATAEASLSTAESAHKSAQDAAKDVPVTTGKGSPVAKLLLHYTALEATDVTLIEAGLPAVGMQFLLMVLGLLVAGGAATRLDVAEGGSTPPAGGAHGGYEVRQPVAHPHAAQGSSYAHVERIVERAQPSAPVTNLFMQPSNLDAFGAALEDLRARTAQGYNAFAAAA